MGRRIMAAHASAEGREGVTPDAVSAGACALDCFLRGAGDPLLHAQQLLAQRPTFAEGYVLQMAFAVAAKEPASLALLEETLLTAGRARVSWDARSRAHLAAAHAWLGREPALAAERYAAILREWPHDVLALRLAQSCYFFLGQTAALREVVDLVWHSWREEMPGFQYVLALAAFACAENGDAARALELARRALAIDPDFPAAIHAVAHALFESGEHARGALWLREQRPHWAVNSRMSGHNAWHLAMFEHESGNATRALSILDRHLLPPSPIAIGDAADGTALLWRLQLDGVDPGDRWGRLSDFWAAHSVPGFWGLLDVHAAIAFNAAGHVDRARAHAVAIERCANGSTTAAELARVALSAVRAIGDFAAGDWIAAAARLRPLLFSAAQLGGSHAQHEIFARMLRYAQVRCHEGETVAA